MQIGSRDDSLSVAHTKEIRKTVPWLRGESLNNFYYERYQKGDKKLVFTIDQKIPVRDTLFKTRTAFNVDSLRTIPYSGGVATQMESVVKTVSGVKVPLLKHVCHTDIFFMVLITSFESILIPSAAIQTVTKVFR